MRSVQRSLLQPAGLLLPLLITGCLSSGGGSSSPPAPGEPGAGDPGTPAPTFYPLFDTEATFSANALPLPINHYFSGTTDGTLNIPVSGIDQPALRTMVELMNDLDGWSTVAPIRIPFNKAVDSASLTDRVRVLRTTLASEATAELLRQAQNLYREQGASAAIGLINDAIATGAHQPLSGHSVPVTAFTCDDEATEKFAVSVSAADDSVVLLKPVSPLAAGDELDCLAASGTFHAAVVEASNLDMTSLSNGYLPLVLEGVSSADAEVAGRSEGYTAAASGATYQAIDQTIDAAGFNPDQVVLGFAFSTQSTTHALDYLAANSPGLQTSFTPAPMQVLPGTLIYNGLLQDAPYYLNNKPANAGASTALTPASEGQSVLSGQWTAASGKGVTRFDVAQGRGPVAEQSVEIPVLLTTPDGTPPANGWPVVIYQHGQGSDRSAALGLAPMFAAQGWALVAIDHPLHGVIDTNQFAGLLMDPQNERHFYIDMDGNGQMDASGSLSMAGTSATARDVRRQTVADLHQLLASLDGIDINGQMLDSTRVGYVGISMGGVIGSMFAGTVPDDRVQAFSLNVPGGGMAKLFDGSAVFAASSRPALAQQGLEFGSQAYEDYFALGQAVEDSGDPINYARAINAGTAGIHLVEMVGDLDNNSPPDLVLPNDLMNRQIYNRIFRTLGLSDRQVTETAPLSGTTPLWQGIGLTPLTSGTATELPARKVVRYAGGNHFSLHVPDRPPTLAAINALFPVADGVATRDAVQRQTIEFLTTQGAVLSISAQEQSLIAD